MNSFDIRKLTTNFIPKVCDFGLSRLADDNPQYTTSFIGPLRWMVNSNYNFIYDKMQAPESIEKRQYSTASDCWTFGIHFFQFFLNDKLGVVCYEIYAQKIPYEGICCFKEFKIDTKIDLDPLAAATGVAFKGLRLSIPQSEAVEY